MSDEVELPLADREDRQERVPASLPCGGMGERTTAAASKSIGGTRGTIRACCC